MVFCTYCGQSFTRDEHLERHILTHTNIKPFKCFTCHMSFARRDLLQRHYTVHGKNQDNQDGLPTILVPKSAGRTPIACTNCAKTKTKCDKKFPCSRCASRNLKCILRPTRRVSRQVGPTHRPSVKPEGEADACSTTSSDSNQLTQVATPEASKSSSPQPQLPLATQSSSNEATAAKTEHASNKQDSNGVQKAPEPPTVYYQQPSPCSQSSQVMHTVLSPQPSPGTLMNGFMSITPMSGYEGFAARPGDSSDQSSPRFMVDWGQYQMPTQHIDQINRPDMILPMDMAMDGLTDTAMLAMMPEFAQSMASLHTPFTTPRMSVSNSLSESNMRHGSVALSSSTRQASLTEDCNPMDLPAVILGQDGWNCFRSAPTLPPSAIPKTARIHIDRLEQSLKNHDVWNSWGPAWQNSDVSHDHLAVVPLQECSKDKLLAITQSFLHKALETHRNSEFMTLERRSSPFRYGSNFIVLPPVRVLTYFLRSYANTFEHFFPISSCGTLDLNDQLVGHQAGDRAASLLTLMMIAAGSLYVPSIEARWLTGGLVEACRLSLFDLVETDISLASDTTVLRAALLLTSTAAWSGDKWHMDIAMGQRGMYTSMLRHSGALEQPPAPQPSQSNSEQLHSAWQQKERISRLVYSWAMLDQDLSLFYDAPPLFSITELGTPMPDSDRLWHAKTTAEWSTAFSQVHEFAGGFSAASSGVRPLSLKDMFRHFLEDDIIPRGMDLTPLHLRLLLHPLQSLVGQYRQLTSCFSDNISPRQQSSNIHTQSVRARLDELQVLLKRWRRLADRYASSHPLCPLMQASMIVFHLISLNTVTSFPEIEKLARKEDFDGSFAQLMWKQKRSITDAEEAIYHCGQIMRLVKGMPPNVRPPWWSGAVYRVGLILWAESLAHQDTMSNTNMFPPKEYIGVDGYAAEHPVLARFRTKKEGRPALTRRDSTAVPIENGFAVLTHCLEIIDEGVANRFTDGIRNKLEKLTSWC